MSVAASGQTLAAKSPSVSHSTRAGLVLQRKCVCGSPAISLTDECAECKSKERLQTKLTIGSSSDPLEQEADRVADQLMNAVTDPTINSAPPRIQRFTAHSTAKNSNAPASVDRILAGSSRPLEPTLQQDMEQRFGHDFSRVRVHSGVAAEQSVRDVNANAYTVGQNIVFGAGRFAPRTHEGRRLIAHELTHVVQQGQGRSARLQRQPIRSGQSADLDPLGGPTPAEIRREIDAIVIRPTAQAGAARADYEADSKIAWARLRGSHFRTEEDRLSYALGIFQSELLEQTGTVDSSQLYLMLLNYESNRRRKQDLERALAGQRSEAARLKRLADRTPATRAERYDVNLVRQGKSPSFARRDASVEPSLLTSDEFLEEWKLRGTREMQACVDENKRPGTIEKCRLAVKIKYMGKDYMEESFAQVRSEWNQGAYIETIKSSGPLSLGGRAVGRGVGYLLGGDEGAAKGEGWGALGGGIGDVATVVGIGAQQRARIQSYQGSAGLEIGRAPIVDMTQGLRFGGGVKPSPPPAAQAAREQQLREMIGEPLDLRGTSQPLDPYAFTPPLTPVPKNFREALDRIDIAKINPKDVAQLRQDYKNSYSRQPDQRLRTEDDYVRFRGGHMSGQWQNPAGVFQLPPALGRAHEMEWAQISGSPRNPGPNAGGRFKTPWANVEPDFVPSIERGREAFARAPSSVSTADSVAAWESALRGNWKPLLVADSKHLQSGIHGLTDQIRGFIWLASFSQSRALVIVGRQGDRLTSDIEAFARDLDVTVSIREFGR